MKIGLITTLKRNIGDDLIRQGICLLLAELFKGEHLEFIPVNKHSPFDVYPAWHPIQLRKLSRWLPRGKGLWDRITESSFRRIGFSRFDDCDLIVQCGAPVFYPHCSESEWAGPIWRDVVGRLFGKIPVLNLAGGSCYPWRRQDEAFQAPQDHAFIRTILGYCRLTTVRDGLARKICEQLGSRPPILPCSAFLAALGRRATPAESGYILINYMTGGGHYEWQQSIDAEKWKETVRSLIDRLTKRHKVVLLCHDRNELVAAGEIAPTLPAFLPTHPQEYFDLASGAKFGLFNRMHACVALAGLGIPSAAICTDTRMLMVSELGLNTHFVSDTNVEELEEQTEMSLRSLPAEQERLLDLQSRTLQSYLASIGSSLAVSKQP